MTINYTNLLGLAKPVTGTETGQWGDVVNDQITELIEDAVANASSISVTSGDVTLTTTTGSSNQARMAVLLITGSPGVSRNIIAPSQSKWYIVKNSSNASIVVKGSATTGVTILADTEALVFWNGSDFEVAGLVGPSSSTDNAVARFDSTTGKVIQNSGVTIDDSNNVSGVAQLNATTADLTNLEVTNIKAKDGTAAASIADSTGVISITSNPILSGGTANGVLYLNGSKVATSGSALTFDGTNFATTGTASATKLIPTGGAITGNGMYLPAANSVAITTNGAQAIYIDSSQNVGIGTSSPGQLLTLSKATTPALSFVRGAGTATIGVDNGGSIAVGASAGDFIIRGTGTTGNTIVASSSGVINAFFSELGNLGIGTTLAAWGSGAGMKAIQIGGTSFSFLAGSVAQYIYGNAYYDGTNNRYINNGTACSYGVNASGQFQWFQAASGIAGNTISFTQAMTLDASGNLGIGNTSPSSYDAAARNLVVGTTSGNNGITISSGTTSTGYLAFARGTTGADPYRGFVGYNHASDFMTFATNGSERARISSSGVLGVGVTPSAWGTSGTILKAIQVGDQAFVAGGQGFIDGYIGSNAYYDGTNWRYISTNGASYFNTTSNSFKWYTAGSGTAGTTISFTQAMTLDTSGNLGIGTTSPDANGRLTVDRSLSNYIMIRVGGTNKLSMYADSGASVIDSQSNYLGFNNNSVERARITTGGDLLVGTSSNIGAGYRSAFVGAGNVVGAQSTTSTNYVFAGLNSSGTVTFSVTGNGAVSKASGSFRIPHPLPAKENTHQLVHSFIEGPQADLIYRGKAALVNGRASVNIDQASGMTDGTFVVLCRDVQCFTSNETDWDAVRGTVVGNILTIECQNGLSTATVSWMVIGERQDKHMYDTDWTDDNGKVIVEPLIKPMVNV